MFDFRTGLGASVVLALVGSAQAQQFAHHIGEVNPDASIGEEVEDISILVDASGEFREIALAGAREEFASQGFRIQGLVIVTDDGGVPSRAWSIDFFGSDFERTSAIRQSTVNGDLLVLELTNENNPNALREAVVMRMDEVTGTPLFVWRYLAAPDSDRWGMEVEGGSGVFAGAVRRDQGTQREGLLVRFDQNTGLPVVNNAYAPLLQGQTDLRFNDVAISAEQNAIFATGAIDVRNEPNEDPDERLVVARFDPAGNVDWIRAYEARIPGEEERDSVGRSIELTEQGEVAVVADSDGDAGEGVLLVLVDALGGAPLATNLLLQADDLDPAYNSLELQGNGSLLASGTRTQGKGDSRAVMWSFDPSSLALDWFFEDDTGASDGNDAIPQPGFGLLLGGQTDPFNFPRFANDDDALLIRTDRDGRAPCSFDDRPEEVEVGIEPIDVRVEVLQLPTPTPEEPVIRDLAERFEPICEQMMNDCVGDFDGDGDVDLGDFGVFGAAFGSMLGDANYNPAADFDMDGDVDLGDFGVFGAEFGRTDCL